MHDFILSINITTSFCPTAALIYRGTKTDSKAVERGVLQKDSLHADDCSPNICHE